MCGPAQPGLRRGFRIKSDLADRQFRIGGIRHLRYRNVS